MMTQFTLKISRILIALLATVLIGCSSPPKTTAPARQVQTAWGKTPDGAGVDLYTLANAKGAEARIITYGGTVVSLRVPNRSGVLGDVVAGFDNLDGYLTPAPYFGALIGRYGNRIGGARFGQPHGG